MRRRWLRPLALLFGLLLGGPGVALCALWRLYVAAELPALAVAAQQPLLLRGVTLVNFDAGGSTHRSGVTLRIADGRIVSIKDDATAPFSGYALPGLIDAHVHSPFLPGDHRLWATLYLLHGVTTVRNLGDGNQSLARKRAVAAGQQAGPRIFTCGIHFTGKNLGFIARTVRTPAQATAAVKEQKAAGADCIKVLPDLSPESFAGIRAAAQAAGLPLVGHVVNAYGDRGIEESGIADVQHLTGVPSVPSPGMNENEWRAFHHGFDTLTPQRIEQIVMTSRRLGIRHTPTLAGAAYEAKLAGGTVPEVLPRLDLVPPWYGALWADLDRARTAEDRALARRNLPRYLDIVQALHSSGVAVQAGSDVLPLVPYLLPGASLHDELRLLVRAGFSPAQALAAATVVPAELLPHAEGNAGLGSIVEGGPADLLLFNADPTCSLDNLDSLKTVIADGRRYERAELLHHLQVQLQAARRFPYSLAGRILRWLLSLVA